MRYTVQWTRRAADVTRSPSRPAEYNRRIHIIKI